MGLGNPGKEFEKTRHNLGYRLVDLIAQKKEKIWLPGKGEFLFCKIEIEDRDIYLVKPLTFMNMSGLAVKQCLERFELDIKELLVLCDDVNLPLGKIRIREEGTEGGHKGLRSIIYYLNSTEFVRLRMGIGDKPEGADLEKWVLEQFNSDEEKIVEEMLQRSYQATEECIVQEIKEVMNRFN